MCSVMLMILHTYFSISKHLYKHRRKHKRAVVAVAVAVPAVVRAVVAVVRVVSAAGGERYTYLLKDIQTAPLQDIYDGQRIIYMPLPHALNTVQNLFRFCMLSI